MLETHCMQAFCVSGTAAVLIQSSYTDWLSGAGGKHVLSAEQAHSSSSSSSTMQVEHNHGTGLAGDSTGHINMPAHAELRCTVKPAEQPIKAGNVA